MQELAACEKKKATALFLLKNLKLEQKMSAQKNEFSNKFPNKKFKKFVESVALSTICVFQSNSTCMRKAKRKQKVSIGYQYPRYELANYLIKSFQSVSWQNVNLSLIAISLRWRDRRRLYVDHILMHINMTCYIYTFDSDSQHLLQYKRSVPLTISQSQSKKEFSNW